jgi:hypothetical protein
MIAFDTNMLVRLAVDDDPQQAELGWRLEQALGLPVDLVVIDPEGPRTAFQHRALACAQDLMPAGAVS